MKTPTELRVATALCLLGIVRSPILLSSQPWLLCSRTRQEAVVPRPSIIPPQVAMAGLGPDVKNVVCCDLPAGRGGGEQPLVLGKTSTEESLESGAYPPVIRRRLSSVLDGALVGEPGCLYLRWSLQSYLESVTHNVKFLLCSTNDGITVIGRINTERVRGMLL